MDRGKYTEENGYSYRENNQLGETKLIDKILDNS